MQLATLIVSILALFLSAITASAVTAFAVIMAWEYKVERKEKKHIEAVRKSTTSKDEGK